MHTADKVLIESFSRLFADLCTPEVIDEVERTGNFMGLWEALEESGLTTAWIPESRGGVGLGLADGLAILKMAGQFALPAPLAETYLAHWLLSQTELEIPMEPIAVACLSDTDKTRVGSDATINAIIQDVAFASSCNYLLLVYATTGESRLALFRTGDLQLEVRQSLAGEPCDRVTISGVQALQSVSMSVNFARSAEALGALARAQQMSGALQSILSQSVGYTQDRTQFGRPIAKFQAVQHLLARLAGEAACAQVAADAAVVAVVDHGIDSEKAQMAVAAAKVRCSEAATAGAAIAHQVHGAMGFTREYSLQQKTRRLWQWREDFGSDSVWALRLGQAVTRNNGVSLWSDLVAI